MITWDTIIQNLPLIILLGLAVIICGADLIKAIDDYINYYNYDRIKVKLKGLSPVNYRLQSSN